MKFDCLDLDIGGDYYDGKDLEKVERRTFPGYMSKCISTISSVEKLK